MPTPEEERAVDEAHDAWNEEIDPENEPPEEPGDGSLIPPQANTREVDIWE